MLVSYIMYLLIFPKGECLLMNENIAVYEALRAHILQKESQIANETIYMYVTYFALLAIGSIWSSWFSLVPFFSLIVFQSMINGDQWAITKASAYIKIFFEEPRDDIHWEQLHHDILERLAGTFTNVAQPFCLFSLFCLFYSLYFTM